MWHNWKILTKPFHDPPYLFPTLPIGDKIVFDQQFHIYIYIFKKEFPRVSHCFSRPRFTIYASYDSPRCSCVHFLDRVSAKRLRKMERDYRYWPMGDFARCIPDGWAVSVGAVGRWRSVFGDRRTVRRPAIKREGEPSPRDELTHAAGIAPFSIRSLSLCNVSVRGYSVVTR